MEELIRKLYQIKDKITKQDELVSQVKIKMGKYTQPTTDVNSSVLDKNNQNC